MATSTSETPVVVVTAQPTRTTPACDEPCHCTAIKTQCGLYFLSAAGYYGLIVLSIYVCLRRGNLILAFLAFLFALLPLILKFFWEKYSKWHSLKESLEQNAATFNRLSDRGTELNNDQRNSVGQANSPNRAVHTVVSGSENTSRTATPPPDYFLTEDPPPSYDEVVGLYGIPRDDSAR